MQGTKFSAVPPNIPALWQALHTHNVRSRPGLLTGIAAFRQTAPVGNSNIHLHLRRLTADDLLSLEENVLLLTPSLPFS